MSKQGLADYFRGFKHPGGIQVDTNLKFIYMKIPKVAGTSILNSLNRSKKSKVFENKRD